MVQLGDLYLNPVKMAVRKVNCRLILKDHRFVLDRVHFMETFKMSYNSNYASFIDILMTSPMDSNVDLNQHAKKSILP